MYIYSEERNTITLPDGRQALRGNDRSTLTIFYKTLCPLGKALLLKHILILSLNYIKV